MESELIVEMCKEMGVTIHDITHHNNLADPQKVFDTRQVRVIILIELARLAIVDGEYCYGESEIIKSLCGSLDVTNTEMDRIIKLAEIYNLLRRGISSLYSHAPD